MTNSWIRKGAPEPQGRERSSHVCGYCRNPWGIPNPDCPNRESEGERDDEFGW